MLFSIPETTISTDDNGSQFWMFHVHLNGVLHCKIRYRQFSELNNQLKKEFDDRVPTRQFPSKKLFRLSGDQLEERRQMLEYYLQTIVQDGTISSSNVFNNFFRDAQKATRKAMSEEVILDIYLMNGNKFAVNILSTDDTDHVLETAMHKIGLSHDFFHYFALFLMKENDVNNGGAESMVVRKLQDFESPYLSLNACKEPHRIVVRKSYWSSKYDDDIMDDRIALNLLYIQVLDDVERGWVLTTEKEKQRLKSLQHSGSKKEFLNLARGLKFYGYIQFKPCICDYPKMDSVAVFAVGERELHMSVTADEKSPVKEGRFQVQAIRCWKLCSAASKSGGLSGMKLSFEYLFGKDKMQWINIDSDQGILISMCLQGIVDEILREKEGKAIRLPKARRKSDSSSTSSQASLKSPKKQVSAVLNDIEGKTKESSKNKNEVFEDIGDDDL